MVHGALQDEIAVDPFCRSLMSGWIANNPILDDYIAFIFDGYEHTVNYFDKKNPASWDFLFNQSFIQYAEFVQDKSEIEYIFDRIILPYYPILEYTGFEFDTEAFLMGDDEVIGFRGDITEYLEEACINNFRDEFLRVLSLPGKQDLVLPPNGNGIQVIPAEPLRSKLSSYKKILHVVKKDTKLVAYVHVLLNTPLSSLKNVHVSTLGHSDFGRFFKEMTENIFNRILQRQPEIAEMILMSIVPRNVHEGVPSDISFKDMMTFYAAEMAATYKQFIETDRLEKYLLDSVEREDIDEILSYDVLLDSLNSSHILDSVNMAVTQGNAHVASFLVRKQKDFIYVLIGFAARQGQEKICENFTKMTKQLNYSDSLIAAIERGYLGAAKTLLKFLGGPSRVVFELLIQKGHNEFFKLAWNRHFPSSSRQPGNDPDLELVTILLGIASRYGRMEIIEFLMKAADNKLFPNLAYAIEYNQIAVIDQYINNEKYSEERLQNLLNRAIYFNRLDMVKLISVHVSHINKSS